MSSPSFRDLWLGCAKKQPCVLWPWAVIVVPECWGSEGEGVWLKETPCPCFCIEGTRYLTLCLLLSRSFPPFQGRYGCCRFLRDGYRTPKEVCPQPCCLLELACRAVAFVDAAQRLGWEALGRQEL